MSYIIQGCKMPGNVVSLEAKRDDMNDAIRLARMWAQVPTFTYVVVKLDGTVMWDSRTASGTMEILAHHVNNGQCFAPGIGADSYTIRQKK